MMKRIGSFLYQFLFVDQNKKQLSHTKFWSHIGFAAMTYTFVYAVMYGTTVDEMIWMLFGLTVIGNRTIVALFNARNGRRDDNDNQPN